MTGPVVGVRPAVGDDLAFLCDAYRLAVALRIEQRGGELDWLLRGRVEPLEASFRDDISSVDCDVTIGLFEQVPVGYCVLRRVEAPEDRVIASVAGIWVHQHARGLGVGAALLQHAKTTAVAWGAEGIDSRALPGDRVTKNFFESFGLVARTIEVYAPLADQP